MDVNKQKTIYMHNAETEESVYSWVEKQLKRKHSVINIARSMIRTDRGRIVISKLHGTALMEISAEEQFSILKKYIETEFIKQHLESRVDKSIEDKK